MKCVSGGGKTNPLVVENQLQQIGFDPCKHGKADIKKIMLLMAVVDNGDGCDDDLMLV